MNKNGYPYMIANSDTWAYVGQCACFSLQSNHIVVIAIWSVLWLCHPKKIRRLVIMYCWDRAQYSVNITIERGLQLSSALFLF